MTLVMSSDFFTFQIFINWNIWKVRTMSQKFILLGFSHENIQIFCFVLFLVCYVSLLVGNILILISTWCSSLSNQTVYYFFSHLSFMDIYYTFCVTPKMIDDCWWKEIPSHMISACYKYLLYMSLEVMRSSSL